MSNKKSFKWITRIQEANFVDDILYIGGLASTRESRDTYGTRPSKEILNYLLEVAPLTNLHLTHGFDNANLILNNVVGRIKEAEIRDKENLWIKASIVYPDIAERVKLLLDNEVLLGFSIGGFFDISREGEFIDGQLNEISLVSLPAVLKSKGTVSIVNDSIESNCFGAICRSMKIKSFQKKEDIIMTKNNKKTNRALFSSDKENGFEDFKTEIVEELTNIINNGFNDFKTEIVEELKNDVKKEVKEEIIDELTEIEKEESEVEEFFEESEEGEAEESEAGDEGTERSIDDESTERVQKKKGAGGSEESDEDEDEKKKKNKKSERSIDNKTLKQIREEVRRETLNDLALKRDVKKNSKTYQIRKDLKKLKNKEEVKRSLTPAEAAKLI